MTYAHLNDGSRIRDVADLPQYIYEQISRIGTNAYFAAVLYGNNDGKGQDVSKSDGRNGKAHLQRWWQYPAVAARNSGSVKVLGEAHSAAG